MFGYRVMASQEEQGLLCAARGNDGLLYVGALGGSRNANGWLGDWTPPGLYVLDGDELAAVEGMEDAWVTHILPSGLGAWLLGGKFVGQRAYGKLWWAQDGVVTVYQSAYGMSGQELVEFQGELLAVGMGVWRTVGAEFELLGGGMSLSSLSTPAAVGARLFSTRARWDGYQVAPEDGFLPSEAQTGPNAVCAFLGQAWGLLDLDTETQALCRCDGMEWVTVLTWDLTAQRYTRLFRVGNRMYLHGHVALEEGHAPDQWPQTDIEPLIGEFDGRQIELGNPFPWMIRKVIQGEREAWAVVADPAMGLEFPGTRYMDVWWLTQKWGADGAFPWFYRRTGLANWSEQSIWAHHVMELTATPKIYSILQEFGLGTGESPTVSAVEQEFGLGTGAGPTVSELAQEYGRIAEPPADGLCRITAIVQEFGTGAGETPRVRWVGQAFGLGMGDSPGVETVEQEFGTGESDPDGEGLLILRSDGESNCVALLATTHHMPTPERDLRGLVRADKATLPVDDWVSWQPFDLNVKTPIDEPGRYVEVGIVGPEGDAAPDVGVQLVRE
jgi:hypothetical protein